jgi:hypothetical protein
VPARYVYNPSIKARRPYVTQATVNTSPETSDEPTFATAKASKSPAAMPMRRSFSGAISMERVKLSSREAEELGWGAKFLFAIAKREADTGGSDGQEVWLETFVKERSSKGERLRKNSARESGGGAAIGPGNQPKITLEMMPETLPEEALEREPPETRPGKAAGSSTKLARKMAPESGSEGVGSKPPQNPGLGRVKTMVAEIERRSRAAALEAESSFSKRAAERPRSSSAPKGRTGSRTPSPLDGAKLTSAKGEGGVMMSPNEEGAVMTSAGRTGDQGGAGGALERRGSLEGLAFAPGPLVKSRSTAVILRSAVSGNPEINQGDDEGFATPGSQFTSYSTPDGDFFSPDRSFSAYSTPRSAAYATPRESFLTPDQSGRSASASPAVSKGSSRSVKPLLPKPSDWNARKGGGPVGSGPSATTGRESASADETGPLGQLESRRDVGSGSEDVLNGRAEGRNESMGETDLGGKGLSNKMGAGLSEGPVETVVRNDSRPLRSQYPDEQSQLSEEPREKDVGALPHLGSSDANIPPDGKRQGVKGPSDLLLVIEGGSHLTALGQGAAGASDAKSTKLGRVSISEEGLVIRKTPQKSKYQPRLTLPVAPWGNSRNREEAAGPVELQPVDLSVHDAQEEVLTGPKAKRAADWLCTLNRIVVDVVRTDRNLEFYDETAHLARMADILAVYAWLDPEVGYCQGMSDLLSPFVVLFKVGTLFSGRPFLRCFLPVSVFEYLVPFAL